MTKRTKRQTIIYKTLHVKTKSGQHEHYINNVCWWGIIRNSSRLSPSLFFHLGKGAKSSGWMRYYNCNQLNIRSSITSDSDLYVETDELVLPIPKKNNKQNQLIIMHGRKLHTVYTKRLRGYNDSFERN
jgi:hypothetical protein